MLDSMPPCTPVTARDVHLPTMKVCPSLSHSGTTCARASKDGRAWRVFAAVRTGIPYEGSTRQPSGWPHHCLATCTSPASACCTQCTRRRSAGVPYDAERVHPTCWHRWRRAGALSARMRPEVSAGPWHNNARPDTEGVVGRTPVLTHQSVR